MNFGEKHPVFFFLLFFSPMTSGQISSEELYQSIVDGRSDALEAYLEEGGQAGEWLVLPYRESPVPLLELAARAGNDEAAALLLEAGAEPGRDLASMNLADLFEAVINKNMTNTLGVLLQKHPDSLAAVLPENHPILHATSQENLAMLSQLMEHLPLPVDSSSLEALNLALVIASSSKSPIAKDLILKLIDAGAKPENTPALIGAVLNCSPELVRVLLEAGSDPLQTYMGKSAAAYAADCLTKRIEAPANIIEQLRDAGVNMCSQSAFNQNPATSAAIAAIGKCQQQN